MYLLHISISELIFLGQFLDEHILQFIDGLFDVSFYEKAIAK